MKFNKISFCPSVLFFQAWCFFRQNARMKHKWLTRGEYIDKRKICTYVLKSRK